MSLTTDDLRRTHAEPTLRRVMLVLTLLIILGTAATTASIVSARTASSASQADVERAGALTAQLQLQTVRAEQRTYEVRQDTRVLLEAICDQVETVAREVELLVPACPSLPPIPVPEPPATPAASAPPG